MNSDPLEKKSTLAQNVIMRQIQRHISRSITNINMRVSDILVDIVIIKLFTTKGSRKNHIRSVLEKVKYPCTLCKL